MLGKNLFMIKEDEDLWSYEVEEYAQFEKNVKQIGTKSSSRQENYKKKAAQLGIKKCSKIKSTNQEFLMTSFMSIGLEA